MVGVTASSIDSTIKPELPGMSRGMHFLPDHSLRIGHSPRRAPNPDEIEIEVAFGGICGTDLHIFHGAMDWRLKSNPHIMGHEISGRVIRTGADVTHVRPNDPVSVMPLHPTGDDPIRRAGLEHICEGLKFLGIDMPGGFQSHWTVPAHTAFKLPTGLSLRHAALIEPIAVACHDIRIGGVKAGDHVVVVGGGPIGALIACVARGAGARVLISEINNHRIVLLRSMGFEVIDPRSTDPLEAIKQRTNGTRADVVFEVSGHPDGIKSALHLVRARGVVVVVGIFITPPPVELFQVFWRELQIRGARVYEREDFRQAIDLAAAGRLPLDQLITHELPLENLETGLRQMEAGNGTMKILLRITP